MSKTVITSSGNALSSKFDKRFGRAEFFCLLDEATGQTTFIANEFKDANHGAGTKAAEAMVELKVTKIISGDFGPKAKELLEKFDVQMVILQEDPSLQVIVDRMAKK